MAAVDRLCTPELLYNSAQQMSLQPSWITPRGMFSMSVGGFEKYVNFSNSVLNSQASASLAKNKYLTRLILERYQMQNIPFARPSTLNDTKAFLHKYKKIVAKPPTGPIIDVASQFLAAIFENESVTVPTDKITHEERPALAYS
jgi:hypothetical protein